jgi:hypothetical protein
MYITTLRPDSDEKVIFHSKPSFVTASGGVDAGNVKVVFILVIFQHNLASRAEAGRRVE